MISKKKVAQICKQRKLVVLAQVKDGTQFAGTGHAMYSMAGMPKMTVPEVKTVFDYSEEEKSKIAEVEETNGIGGVADDNYSKEILVEERSRSVYYKDCHYILFNAQGVAILINAEFLTPIKTCGETRYYIRFNESNAPLLCVKTGMLVEAVIFPVLFNEEELGNLLQSLADTSYILENQYEPTRKGNHNDAEEDEQQEME